VSQFIIYGGFANSLSWYNWGSDGTTYTGTANANHYGTQYGQPYYGVGWYGSEHISVPSGTKNSYPANRQQSLEIGLKYNGLGVNGTYGHLWDKGAGGVSVGYQVISGQPHLVVYFTTSGNPAYWISDSWYFTAGHNYYLQIAWGLPAPASCTNGNVHVHIGGDLNAPQHISMNNWQAGTGSWYNDAGSGLMLGNYPGNNYNFSSSFYVMREFDTKQNWDSYSDWASDLYRWSPTQDTSISCATSNPTPPIGANYNITGTLQTMGGTKLSGKTVIYWRSTDKANWSNVGTSTTDGNGNFTKAFTAVAGTVYYGSNFAGDSGYNASSSAQQPSVTGQSVNASAYPAVITTEAKPIAPGYGDAVYPNVISCEAAPLDGITLNLGVNATVVGCECDVILNDEGMNCYPDILGQQTYCFPPGIQLDAQAMDMLVSLLSTQVLPGVLEPECGPSTNYQFVMVSEDAPTNNVGAECGVLDPIVKIDYPEILEVDAILEEILEADAHIEDTIHIPITVTKDLELQLEVTTE
jgi:hypothetical protein